LQVKLIIHAQTSNALNSCVISIGIIETALLSINSLSLGLSLGLS
jgi:hypothetical protein